MKYAGRIYTAGVQDYCSSPQDSREEAATLAFRARPKAESCVTSEVHDGVPTHYGVIQHWRPELPTVPRSFIFAISMPLITVLLIAGFVLFLKSGRSDNPVPVEPPILRPR